MLSFAGRPKMKTAAKRLGKTAFRQPGHSSDVFPLAAPGCVQSLDQARDVSAGLAEEG